MNHMSYLRQLLDVYADVIPTDRRRDMFKLRFGLPPYDKRHTYREIGERHGITMNSARLAVIKAERIIAGRCGRNAWHVMKAVIERPYP